MSQFLPVRNGKVDCPMDIKPIVFTPYTCRQCVYYRGASSVNGLFVICHFKPVGQDESHREFMHVCEKCHSIDSTALGCKKGFLAHSMLFKERACALCGEISETTVCSKYADNEFEQTLHPWEEK